MTDSARAVQPDASPGSVWRQRARRWSPLIALFAVTVVAAVVAPEADSGLPLDPTSTAEDGTRGLVAVLDELGYQVEIVDPTDVGNAPVVLVPFDQFTDQERAALVRRVEAGARVVIADPRSELTPPVDGQVGFLEQNLERSCDVAALRDVRIVHPAGGRVFDVPRGSTGCFETDAGAWLVITARGRGSIVALGSGSFLTNSLLASDDNEVLAVHLLTPRGADRIEIVRPVLRAASGDQPANLIDMIGPGVRALLVQLLIGFLVVVAWRARRLGRALVERQPVTLASSDLTSAVGAMLSRNQARAATLQRVADDTRTSLANRLGLPVSVDLDALAARIAERTAQERTTVLGVLDPPAPPGDAALLAATTALADLERSVLTALSGTADAARDREETDAR